MGRLSAHSRTDNQPSSAIPARHLVYLVQETKDLEKLKVFPTNLNKGADSSFESRDRVYVFNNQALASAVSTGPTSQGMRRPGCEEASPEGQQKQGEERSLRVSGLNLGSSCALVFPWEDRDTQSPEPRGLGQQRYDIICIFISVFVPLLRSEHSAPQKQLVRGGVESGLGSQDVVMGSV